MNFKDNYRKFLVIILLPAISWLFFNSVYYRHLHQLSSGITITHAHPYNKTTDDSSTCPFPSHNHTEDEYILYDVISNTIVPILFGLIGIIVIFKLIIEKRKLLLQEQIYHSDFYSHKNYRGPPVKF